MEPRIADFESLEDLYEVDFVKHFKQLETHTRFTINRWRSGGELKDCSLMAESSDGRFTMVGYLKHDIPELPAWIEPKANNPRPVIPVKKELPPLTEETITLEQKQLQVLAGIRKHI
jgi:hypothetical protein